MKTQSSLEVPKQVRSASFDEIQLEAQRANQFLKVHQSSADEPLSPGLGLLQVPQVPGAGQRSRSFDLTGAGGEEAHAAVAAAFLDVPKRFQRRKSSSKTPPPCIHCLYLEEYRRLTGVDQRQYYDNSEYQTLSYTSSSSDEDEDDDDDEDEEDDDQDEDPDDDRPGEEDPGEDFDFTFPGCNVQCNTLLPPPLVSPCGITFTLSPTNGDDIEDGGVDPEVLPEIGPILPPPPMFDTPSYPPLPPFALGSLPIGSPPITPCSAYPPPSPTIEVPPCSPSPDDPPGAGATRTRRRSISRQEAIFVEPTGNSLENVSSAEPTTSQDINIIVPDDPDEAAASSSRNQSCESVDQSVDYNDNQHQFHQYHLPRPSLPAAVAADFVRDIYLQVPDLKRDRAASVDSCFTKVTGAKTEEVKPP
ncbi:hypothetical protein pipiens_012271, partial [Culex pipiens pipiens]